MPKSGGNRPAARGGDLPLRGRHAAVTGASRGIGAAIADALARLGADVTLLARDEELLRRRAEEINGRTEQGGRARTARLDVTDEASVEAAFGAAVQQGGAVSILVNCSGVAGSVPFHRMEVAHWRETLDTNLTGTFLCTRQVYPAMRDAGWGRIVNIASTAGLAGYPYIAAYTASKHGVVGLTRALALEAAKTGVTVNAVCPGYTETEMVRRTIENIAAKTGRSEEEALQQIAANNPQGRLIQPEEVAGVVTWLCLPGADSVTGQSIVIAGGEVM